MAGVRALFIISQEALGDGEGKGGRAVAAATQEAFAKSPCAIPPCSSPTRKPECDVGGARKLEASGRMHSSQRH